MELNPKLERFAQLIVEGLSQSEAYRQSHPNAAKWKNESVWVKASELMDKDTVAVRIAELRAAIADQHDVTVSSLIRELEEARTAALTCETPQSSAAVAATMGKARITGKDKQVMEINLTSSIGDRLAKARALLGVDGND